VTRDEAVLLARKFLSGAFTSRNSLPVMELAAFVVREFGSHDPKSGAAESVPPAVPSEHGLQNAVPTPEDMAKVMPSGDPRSGSFASMACCNQCSSEHHHCPNCSEYVRGEGVIYCSTRCEKAYKGV